MKQQVRNSYFLSFCVVALGPISLWATPIQTGMTPSDGVVADFNNDGLLDLAVCHVFDDSLAIVHQDPIGTYQVVQQETVGISPTVSFNAARSLVSSDFNCDGSPDLTVLCSGTYLYGAAPSYQTLLNAGDGTFIPMEPVELAPISMGEQFPVKMVSGEFTGDEFSDLAIAHNRGNRIEILSGDGTGQFVSHDSITLSAPENIVVEDVNIDGQDDLIVLTGSDVFLLTSTGASSYNTPINVSLPESGAIPRSAIFEDWNHDGVRDLIVVDAANRLQVLYSFDATGAYGSSQSLTDVSLNDPQDITALCWDGDALSDLFVANLGADTATVFLSDGQVEVHTISSGPRRLIAADMDRDGRHDMVAISQGDQSDSSNADVVILANEASPTNDGTANLDISEDLETLVGLRLDHPRSVSAASPTSVWILSTDGTFVQEVNPNAGLGSNPSARLGDQFTFPFEAGGVVMTSTKDGIVLEKETSRLHEFTIKNGLGDVIDFSTPSDAIGFCGLAYDSKSDLFFVSIPGENKVLKVDDTGAVIGQFTTEFPLWDLCYDSTQKLVFGSVPNRAEILAYTEDGTPTPSASISLRGVRYLALQGFNGLGYVKSLKRFYLATPDGLMLEVAVDGEIKDNTTLAPAADAIASAYDADKGILYFLGKDGYLASMKRDGLNDPKLISLWPLMEADPDFVPGGLAFNQTDNVLLVGDALRPIVGELHTNGSFRGMVDHQTSVPVLNYTGGVAIRSVDGTLYFRHLDGIVDNSALNETVALPRSVYAHISLFGDSLAVPSSNPGELLFYSMDALAAEPVTLTLPVSLLDRAFVQTGESSLYLLFSQGEGSVEGYDVDLSGTTVVDWSVLD